LFWYPVLSLVVVGLSFAVIGPFYMAIDGWIYTAQVEQFAQGSLVLEPFSVALRAFKPFPGLVGSFLVPPLTPEQSLQLLNLGFAFAFPFVGYWFLRELEIDSRPAFWGGAWMVTGYPVLKYGLAIATDLGSWVFALLTVALVLRAIRKDSLVLFLAASVLGFLGGTVKETGVIGLLFGGLALLFTAGERPWRGTLMKILALSLPAFLLELGLFAFLVFQGFPSFLEWFGLNSEWYPTPWKERLFMFVGVNGSAFHLLGLYSVVGAGVFLTGQRGYLGRFPIAYGLALLLAPLPVYLWPLYIGRILYIQVLIVVPLALAGVSWLVLRFPEERRKGISRVLYLAPIATAIALFLLAGKGSLFDLLR
jgi:hypothetical protein